MPDLTGKTPSDAEATLRSAGFTGAVAVNRIALECEDAAKDEGKINCQSPGPGELAYKNHEVNVHVYQAQTFPGMLVRHQLAPLKGMKVAEAKAYLKKMGHDGKVRVEQTVQFVKSCKPETICEYSGESGIGVHDEIILMLNKSSVDITMPD